MRGKERGLSTVAESLKNAPRSTFVGVYRVGWLAKAAGNVPLSGAILRR